MSNAWGIPGIVGPFAGMDVPWLLRMRSERRGDHPFLIWAPFDAPARKWTFGEFHDRVGALAAGLVKRGIRPGEFLLIHLDNCPESVIAWLVTRMRLPSAGSWAAYCMPILPLPPGLCSMTMVRWSDFAM